MAQINFQETHRAFRAPPHADPAKVVIPPYYPDHPVTREDWAKYLDAATELDRKIGLILKQLEADGLADSTVVFFTGDHGQAHVRGKQFCYDSGLRVPLIIRWPKNFPAPAHFKPGTVDDRLLASIDLSRDDAGDRRREEAGEDAGRDLPRRRSRPAAEVCLRRSRPLRRDRLPLPHRARPTAIATSTTSRPSGPSCSPTTTRSGPIPCGTCSSSSTPKAS